MQNHVIVLSIIKDDRTYSNITECDLRNELWRFGCRDEDLIEEIQVNSYDTRIRIVYDCLAEFGSFYIPENTLTIDVEKCRKKSKQQFDKFKDFVASFPYEQYCTADGTYKLHTAIDDTFGARAYVIHDISGDHYEVFSENELFALLSQERNFKNLVLTQVFSYHC